MAKISVIPQVVNDPTSTLDVGSYLFSCESVKEGEVNGKFVYDAVFRVQQPASHQGQLHYERWWIGSDEDPEATLPDTWTKNAGYMKKCCEAAGVPFTGQSPDLVIQQLYGKMFCAKIVHKQSTKDGKTYTNAKVQQYGQPGTMTPEVIGSDNGQPPATPSQPPVASAPGVGTTLPPQHQSAPATGMPPSPVTPQQGGQPAPVNPSFPPQYQ